MSRLLVKFRQDRFGSRDAFEHLDKLLELSLAVSAVPYLPRPTPFDRAATIGPVRGPGPSYSAKSSDHARVGKEDREKPQALSSAREFRPAVIRALPTRGCLEVPSKCGMLKGNQAPGPAGDEGRSLPTSVSLHGSIAQKLFPRGQYSGITPAADALDDLLQFRRSSCSLWRFIDLQASWAAVLTVGPFFSRYLGCSEPPWIR